MCAGILNNKFKGARPCTHINHGSSSMHTRQTRALHPCTHINQGSSSMYRKYKYPISSCRNSTKGFGIQLKWSTRPFNSVVQYIDSAGVVGCLKP